MNNISATTVAAPAASLSKPSQATVAAPKNAPEKPAAEAASAPPPPPTRVNEVGQTVGTKINVTA